MGAPPTDDYQVEFARIERQVDRGAGDLGSLGFWRLVRRVKREPRLANHWAEEIGRIEAKAFDRRAGPRFPLWLGNAVLGLGTGVLIALVPVALAVARDDPGSNLAGLLAVVAAGGLSTTVHDLAHWAVGRLAGIRFRYYFLDGPLRIQPGLKIDYASYLRASPGARARMHAAGAVASKLAPFTVFTAVYLPHRAAGYELLPAWSLWAILGIGAIQLVSDLVFSTRKSDWKKVRRELKVGRAQRAE